MNRNNVVRLIAPTLASLLVGAGIAVSTSFVMSVTGVTAAMAAGSVIAWLIGLIGWVLGAVAAYLAGIRAANAAIGVLTDERIDAVAHKAGQLWGRATSLLSRRAA